jgi:fructose-1,6-bisphosphatase/inositol monophosphatase family enzyme
MQRALPDPAAFVAALAPALRRAAALARTLEGRVANRPKVGEATPVKAALTAADTASQEVLLSALFEHFPHVHIEAEEDTPTVHRFGSPGESTVVVDPIDGTLRFFLEGVGPYAVMLGLAIRGSYVASLVALPREELYFDAVFGGGARVARGEAPPAPARSAPQGRRVFISHDLPGPAVEVLLAHGFEVAPACGGAIALAPLLPGVRAGLRWVREGLSTRARIGALIASEAGALVRGERGEPFGREVRSPSRALLVAADARDLAALEEAASAARAC